MGIRDDKPLFYIMWVGVSYAVACYLFVGSLVLTTPTPHAGSGVAFFGWLLSPAFPLIAAREYMERGIPSDQLPRLLGFFAVLIVCLIVVGAWLRVPIVQRLLRRTG